MIRPNKRFLTLLLGLFLLGLAASSLPVLVPAFWLAASGLSLLAGVEIVWLRRKVALSAHREMPAVLPVGVWSEIQIELRGNGKQHLKVAAFDHPPVALEFADLPQRVDIPSEGFLSMRYRVRPHARGDHRFETVELLVPSRLKCFERRVRLPCVSNVRVLPNFRTVSKYAILAMDDRLGQMGIKLARRRGEGLEFQELRDYREGDTPRQIDWAATARRSKPISRQYQEEKDQQVVFLLDCGRRMHSRDGDLAHFDHVLNAILLLTYVAVRQGDSVGILTFGGEQRWLPPQKGVGALNTVLNTVYDLETGSAPPDYLEASRRLMTLQRRRALVVLISNLRDEDAPELVPALHNLRRRNLVLLASLREAAIGKLLEREVFDFRGALNVAATRHYLEARKRAYDQIVGRGVLTLDTEPEQLPHLVVNRYLDIKRSGAL